MSNKPYRLLEGGSRIDRSKRVTISFDGKQLPAFAGDTVASAVMANGSKLFGRSFKYHRPRGVVGLGSEEMNALVGVGDGARHEPNLRLLGAAGDPRLGAGLGKDHGHAVVDRRHIGVWLRREDGEGLDRLAFLRLPRLPETGEGEDRPAVHRDGVGLLAARLAQIANAADISSAFGD